MSLMSGVPVPRPATVKWHELLTLGPEDDPMWDRVRMGQLYNLGRTLPLNLVVTGINSVVALATFAQHVWRPVLVAWFLLQAGVLLSWAWRGFRVWRNGIVAATPRLMRTIALEMGLWGLAWGLLFAEALPDASPFEFALLMGMIASTIGVSVFTTSIFLLAACAIAAPIAIGAMVGMAAWGWEDMGLLWLVLGSILIVTARGNVLTAEAFLARLRWQDLHAEQEKVVRLLLNEFEANGSEWLFEFDSEGSLTLASGRFAEVVGKPVSEVVGLHWTSFLSDRQSGAALMGTIRRGLPFRDLVLKVDVRGESRWWSLSGTPKFSREGLLIGYRGVGSDVTERQQSAERIAELATFDSLTGLVNRRVVHQALADGMTRTDGVALLFVDLDRFKSVNDSLGHAAGDRLLAEAASRLHEVAAVMAGNRALVGRLGGDEFAVVLRSADEATALAVGEELIRRISQPYRIDDKQAVIGASIGLALGPVDGDSVEALMRAADLALYDVKRRGRGSVRHYDRELHRQAESLRALEMDLRQALSQGQIRLEFQPVVDTIDERVVGFEALMRWRHPVEGDVPPAIFIPIAEESGLISKLGAWALNEACRVAAGWPRHMKLAVNLSPMQFDDPNLVKLVRSALERHGIAPERLELELTESLFLEERSQTSRILNELRQLGVGFALDDFGTGYSSLGYLQKIAFTRIKIDRSFVQACVKGGGESLAIVQAIVALADRLGMETTAEGAETRAEFEAVRRLGCAQVQGYYFGRPMSPDDVAGMIERSRPLIRMVNESVSAAPFSSPTLPSDAAECRQWLSAAEQSSQPIRQALPEHPAG